MRVLVTGGRGFKNYEAVRGMLDALNRRSKIEVVIHGGATGADSLAGRWAKANGVECVKCKANWTSFGKAAGPIRNREMLRDNKPDVVLAFPGGNGTANMIEVAKNAGVKVIQLTEVSI